MIIDQATLIQTLSHTMDKDHIKLLLGMTLGIKTPYSDLDDILKTVGLTHVMVLSGANISFFVLLVQKIIGMLQTKYQHLLIVLLLVCIPYVFNPEVSVIRATIMVGIPMILMIFEKPQSHQIHVLILTGLIMLIYEPHLVGNISFQLSFGAIFGIFLFGVNGEQKKERGTTFLSKIKLYFNQTLKTSLAAQAFTTPLIFYHFGTISLIAPLANILVGWVVGFIMISGLLHIFIELQGITLVRPISSIVVEALIQYFLTMSNLVYQVPFAQIRY